MLITNVSLARRRAAIAAEVAEAAAAIDSSTLGNIVFATLVDDPASVGEIVDAYLGEVMVEVASATDALSATVLAIIAADVVEAATASAAQDASSGISVPGVTGLIGWWDASVTASLSLSGTDILSVADQSGLGNTMNWTNAKPQYNATGFNSGTRPAIVLASAGQVLQATSFPMGTGNTLTMWLVTTMPASGTMQYGRYFSYTGAGGGADYNNANHWLFAQNSFTATQCVLYRNGNIASSPTATAYPAPHRIIATVTSTGVMTVYIDGISGSTITSGGNWVDGGILRIGADNVVSSFLVAPIAECGVATGYSDATAVAQLDTYLKTKWGL